MSGYAGAVRILIAKLLVIAAVLLMPFGMAPVAAAETHQMQTTTMPMRHCPDNGSDHHGKGGIAECTMACSAALPAADTGGSSPRLLACTPLSPGVAQRLMGLHPGPATPPPRES